MIAYLSDAMKDAEVIFETISAFSQSLPNNYFAFKSLKLKCSLPS